MAKKTFYCVVSYYYDSGRTGARIETGENDTKPENTFERGLTADRYRDWFDNENEARDFATKVRNA